jgi:Pectate lyase superfamily protein
MTGLGRRQLLFGAGATAAAKLTAGTGHPARTAGTVPATLTADTVGPTPGWVNVSDYGAVGNGIHDDTAAVKAAIKAVSGSAPPASRTRFPTAGVYLPPGAYKITADLLIQSVEGFVFAGGGSDLTYLLASGPGFTTAVLNIDGSAKGKYQGFSIVGDGTESSGKNALPNAINFTWTTAASRSTTANILSDIYVKSLKFSCGIRMGAPSGTTRQVDSTTIRDVIVAGSGTATYTYSALYLCGFCFGNGIYGNQYDFAVYNSWASGCRIGVYAGASGFVWYGGQPAENGTEFYFAGEMGQTAIQGIQSQDSGQLLYATGGSIVTTVSVRDVVFATSYLVSNDHWIHVTGIARGWEFSNVRIYNTTAARPVIFFSGSGNVEVATLINVAQRNTAAAGVVVQSGGSVKLVNYMQLNAISEVTAVWHDFIVTKVSAYTCTQSDRYVLADAAKAAYTVTLPSAALCPGKVYTVKKIDASTHAVTVTTAASQTIDGAKEYPLRHQHNAVELVSNGSGWFVTAKL